MTLLQPGTKGIWLNGHTCELCHEGQGAGMQAKLDKSGNFLVIFFDDNSLFREEYRRMATAPTRRKNIEKDSRAYFLSHEAHRLFQRMAKKKHLPIGAFMELSAQELAQSILTEEERREVAREAEAITAARRTEAEAEGARQR